MINLLAIVSSSEEYELMAVPYSSVNPEWFEDKRESPIRLEDESESPIRLEDERESPNRITPFEEEQNDFRLDDNNGERKIDWDSICSYRCVFLGITSLVFFIFFSFQAALLSMDVEFDTQLIIYYSFNSLLPTLCLLWFPSKAIYYLCFFNAVWSTTYIVLDAIQLELPEREEADVTPIVTQLVCASVALFSSLYHSIMVCKNNKNVVTEEVVETTKVVTSHLV